MHHWFTESLSSPREEGKEGKPTNGVCDDNVWAKMAIHLRIRLDLVSEIAANDKDKPYFSRIILLY